MTKLQWHKWLPSTAVYARFGTKLLLKSAFITLIIGLLSGPAFSDTCGGKKPIPLNEFKGILALTWENGFCELQADTKKGRRSHPECVDRTDSDQFASRFALHGLWPSCNGTRDGGPRSCPIEEFNFADTKKAELLETFPTLQLAKHEWQAHGGCFGGKQDDDPYFETSLRLFREFDQSSVQTELGKLVGQKIKAGTIETIFDQHFGLTAGDKVTVSCKLDQISRDRSAPRVLIVTEIQLNLASSNPLGEGLKSMMANSDWIDSRTECDGRFLTKLEISIFIKIWKFLLISPISKL